MFFMVPEGLNLKSMYCQYSEKWKVDVKIFRPVILNAVDSILVNKYIH